MIEPIISEGKLLFCAGVDIKASIDKAQRIAINLYEMFKDDKDKIIQTNFSFESSIPVGCNYVPKQIFPKFTFFIITDSGIKDDSDFVIEVNIILDKLTCYKFDMRWKKQKEE